MSTINKRRTYWRDHVLTAAAFDGTIVKYATLHNLKTKDIYQWKTALLKKQVNPHNYHQNRTDESIASTVVEFSLDNPHLGQVQVANHFKKH